MSDEIKKMLEEKVAPFERLVKIMAILRSENGCAWDRKQTHRSLLPYLIEETYEVIETIEAEDWCGLKEELGDLLCQIIFHAQLASERGEFTVDDSIESISNKLISRHPHVFEDKKDLDPTQVRDQWEKNKIESGEKKSVLSGLPKTMPALTTAFRMGEKAAGVGFDWNDTSEVVVKLEEELVEVRAELESGDKAKLADEIGDLLFATASLARKADIDPELALRDALAKFKGRFDLLEERVKDSKRPFGDYSLEELEAIWQEIKK